MNDLLDLAIAAHGGWDRWQRLTSIRAHVAIGGSIWHLKGWPDVFGDAHVAIDPHKPHTEYSAFPRSGMHSLFERDRTAIVADGGAVIEERERPRERFAGHSITTPWDAQQLIYFSGYAMWTYLTTPFLFRLPGFQSEEIATWHERGEEWRRLQVTFPSSVPSHSSTQTFYFDQTGLLRRHDYSIEIMGGTRSANYATDHANFGGLIVPTIRRVYAIGADNKPLLERIAVSIDFQSIELSWAN